MQKIKRGDTVEVITGIYKGKRGKVLKVFPKENRVIVEGVNIRVHHERARGPDSPGGRIKKEGPIHVSNVMLVCPKCGKKCEIYSRIVGYLRPVNQWNEGKRAEFTQRKTFVA